MEKVEFRVRPVIRHVVTRYATNSEPGGVGGANLSTLGEFDNEGYAEIVRQALAERAAPREYVLVERTGGEIGAMVFYAVDEHEACERAAALSAEYGREFRAYSRLR